MRNAGEKPTVVIYGNCAGQTLASVLRQVSFLTERFDVHWVRNFSIRGEGDEQFDPNVLPRCAFFLEQLGNFRGDKRRQAGDLKDLPLPPGCRHLRFPPLFMNTLWPFVASDPRSDACRMPGIGEGPYPKYVCNRLILDLMERESDPDRVYDQFMNIRVRDHVDLDRLHQLTMSKIRGLDRDGDFSFGDFIDQNFSSKRLFLMQIHPTGHMVRELCAQVTAALEVPEEATAPLLQGIEGWRGIGGYDAPIHPDIAEHFGLQWAHGLLYRHHSEGYFSYSDFIRRYIRLEWTPTYYIGMQLASEGQLVAAEALLAEAVASNPSEDFVAGLRQVRNRYGKVAGEGEIERQRQSRQQRLATAILETREIVTGQAHQLRELEQNAVAFDTMVNQQNDRIAELQAALAAAREELEQNAAASAELQATLAATRDELQAAVAVTRDDLKQNAAAFDTRVDQQNDRITELQAALVAASEWGARELAQLRRSPVLRWSSRLNRRRERQGYPTEPVSDSPISSAD